MARNPIRPVAASPRDRPNDATSNPSNSGASRLFTKVRKTVDTDSAAI